MIEDLKKRLLEGDEEERRVAVEALGGLREKEAVLLLVSALGDKSWRVRKTSEEILEGFAGEESLVPALIGSLRSEDNAGMRNSAASVLVRIGWSAIPYLIETLKDVDKDIRKFAVDILGEIGDKTAISPLVDALRDSDDNVRSSAAEALGKIGGDEVVNALVYVLTNTEDDIWLRYSALEALGKTGSRMPIEPIIMLLDEKLLRKAAMDALAKSCDPRAIPHLVAGLQDKSRGCREAAVTGLNSIYKSLPFQERLTVDEEIRANANSHLLTGLLDSPSIDIKKGAVVILGIMGGGADPAMILNLASDERMQDAVTDAFVKMGEKGLEVLTETFPDADDKMRSYICMVIGKIGDKKGVNTLTSALSDPYGHTRQSAALAIAEIGAIETLPLLVPLLLDEFEDVEEAAVQAIIRLSKESQVEAVRSLLDGIASREPRLRRNITAILGGIGSKDALPAIISSLKDEDSDVRKAAATAIGNLMLKEGIDPLAIALADEDGQVRLAGVNALSRFQSIEAGRLLALASDDTDIWVRCAALKGLSKIGDKNAEKILSRAVMDEVGVVAITAIESLFAMKGVEAVETVKKGLRHNNPDVAWAAEKTLSKIAK